MEYLPVQRLRVRTSEYVARAELGEAFVVMRHQRPLAVLRPSVPEDSAPSVPVSDFRSSLRVWLKHAQDQRFQLSWRGRRVASVEPPDPARSLGGVWR
jgi:antitoxin (DNA-binding transcriptional repressor) of toxin-antitoxin stability system